MQDAGPIREEQGYLWLDQLARVGIRGIRVAEAAHSDDGVHRIPVDVVADADPMGMEQAAAVGDEAGEGQG
jgi:hypothetical protein